jgi:hypothetical protein
MKGIVTLVLAALVVSSCHKPLTTQADSASTPPDSLKIVVTANNLSEDISGNDELVVLGYLHQDTLELSNPIVASRLVFPAKKISRQVNVKLAEDITGKSLLLFLLEQDADWSVSKIDSVLRVSHSNIRKAHATRNYTEIEKYLADDDVLGIKIIPGVKSNEPQLVSFTGIYKLDRYDYLIRISFH